ncbi:hypothetical protein N665_0099s0018 [Sinapis alba]|nr:hypothetical protein N665_0099s0018 [Sinapis alba]
MGYETGYIRFHEPEASQKACVAAVLAKEGGLAVKNFIAVLEPRTVIFGTGKVACDVFKINKRNQRLSFVLNLDRCLANPPARNVTNPQYYKLARQVLS